MLRPIIRRFVAAFDGEPDTTFWSHIVHRNNGLCGHDDLSGWITAFCVWPNKGVWKGGSLPSAKPAYAPTATTSPAASDSIASTAVPASKRLDKVIPKWLRRRSKALAPKLREESTDGAASPDVDSKGDDVTATLDAPPDSEGSVMVQGEPKHKHQLLICNASTDESCTDWKTQINPTYTLDGVPFFVVPVSGIPPGYCEVDVTVDDNGKKVDCMMVAGHVAFSGSSAAGSTEIDTVSPEAHWFIFEKKK